MSDKVRANIVITLDGEVSIITQEGDFEIGKIRIEELLEALNLEGLQIELEKPIEQHRHDNPGEVHHHAHAH